MGMTYWIHTLEGGNMSEDSDDHSWMHRLSDELDAACRALGVPELSSFADYTDLELNMTDEDDDEEWDEEAFDDEVQYGNLKDKMQWFDPAAGLKCMEALRQHVAGGWNAELGKEERSDLIEELEDCINILKALPPGAGKFNLAVIM